jgi:hypothetical protein
MTTIAWIFMISSWCIVTFLFLFCIKKALCADKITCKKK